ncbi:hypothetical protein RJ641_004671 [Dillenia turbinata]|uniref:Protein EFR3 n=1 Tax=Dillenia turbinata TaxID=194707 RepID=A0AAN8VJF3_9MAGN
MGVMSRRVVPACGNLCFFCPSMRARSRQPVKRYKKLLGEIFPKSQDAEPNDRKIGKLCEYASRNPLRVPKITGYLEHRCYKDLRVEHFGSVKVVWFMGEHSHISMDFDKIVSATLENYLDLQKNPDKAKQDGQYLQPQDRCVQGVFREEVHGSSFPDMIKKIASFKSNGNSGLDLTMDMSKGPSYWSKVCLRNMAGLAKEATTVRRVLEPLFHNFDTENQWSLENGVAYSVLMYLQSLLEEKGENSHLLLSMLVKHLDHKNVVKQSYVQINILNCVILIAQTMKQQESVGITGAIADLIKHLRKCMQNSAEVLSSGVGIDRTNTDLQSALENCIAQLSNKVGDVGPILDTLAVVLENFPTATVPARTTVSAVFRTIFPDALFHQLLLAMAHPDHETRIGAHHVFSTVLMPSLVGPSDQTEHDHKVSLPVFMSKEGTVGSFSIEDDKKDYPESTNEVQKDKVVFKKETNGHACTESYSFKRAMTGGKAEFTSLRLSSHQVSLLLSSIWVQATYAENSPANFEAMAHTYNIALLFTRSKTSSYLALVRCFQLAFSLRKISLEQDGGLQPSCRRSLFTLASCMLIFSARAGGLRELIPILKASLPDTAADPYLELIEDIRLQAVCTMSDGLKKGYGSDEDEVTALKSLSAIEVNDQQLREEVISYFMHKLGNLSEDELSGIKQQLLQDYSPDDTYPLGAQLFMETPQPMSPLAQMEFQAIDEIIPAVALTDDEAFPEANGSQSDRKSSLSINAVDILSVNQLLDSVLETARHVASFPVSSTPIPYDQMKSQCEALISGKQEKMSVLQSFKQQHEVKETASSCESDDKNQSIPNMLFHEKMELTEGEVKLINKEETRVLDLLLPCGLESRQHSLRLPPSSPYDKFLKAAGC